MLLDSSAIRFPLRANELVLDNLYGGDWKHACDYVDAATEVLDGAVDHQGWNKQMRDCIWNRDPVERDRLLHQAHMHRDEALLAPERAVAEQRLRIPDSLCRVFGQDDSGCAGGGH